jgi:NADH:ubiquinone oxidoreductase subunit E
LGDCLTCQKPVGKFHVQVCTNISCSLLGAEHIVESIEKKLGIGLGQTTLDGKFTLSEVECLGSCGTAPMAQINDDYHENLTPEGVLRLLNDLAK